MVDPFNLSFQPVLHDLYNKGHGIFLSCLWDGAVTRFLAANRKVAQVVVAAGFLSSYLNGPLPYARHHITVNKMYRMHI